MIKIHRFLLICVLLLANVFSSLNSIAQSSSYIKISEHNIFDAKLSVNTLHVNLNFPGLNFNTERFETDTFTVVETSGFGKNYVENQPDIPVYIKLIFVPENVHLELTNLQFDEGLLHMSDKGFRHPIKPAISSISKSSDNQFPFPRKGEMYSKNEFFGKAVVSLNEVGLLRDIKIYEIVYHPISYNPVQNIIKYKNNVTFDVVWSDPDFEAGQWNFNSFEQTLEDVEMQPSYAIVAPLAFEDTMQQFVRFKEQLGFYVHEIYIGKQIKSNNKNDLKAYLSDLYKHPPEGIQPLNYLLIVGDVDQVPTWEGQTENHVSDLNYAEFTNDFLPELYYGRISVTNNDELQAVIDKTIFVEKGLGVANAYQNKHVLISGVDPDFATKYGNGAVQYILDSYSNEQLGINTSYYLYGSGSPILSESTGARQAILNDLSDGSSIVYYTAHCDENGWENPPIVLSDIDNFKNNAKYPLIIGNCCESLRFEKKSFGEKIVKAKNKGAVAYIGATNYSYWDEDYFWAVGYTSNININTTYANTGIGAFDSWFHTHNESETMQASTVAEILLKGSLAVQESSSLLKDYYWEIYQIMGDPSLVPVKYEYPTIDAEYELMLKAGIEHFQVQTEPGAVISLMHKNEVIGVNKADATGYCNVNIKPVEEIGIKNVELLVSKPGFNPIVDSVNVQPSEGAFVTFSSVIVNDSIFGNNNNQVDFGEKIAIQLVLKNYGNEMASNVLCRFNSQSSYIANGSSHEINAGNIEKNKVVTLSDTILIETANFIPNNEIILFSGVVSFNEIDTSNFQFQLKVNSPEIVLNDFFVDASGIGNLDGIIDQNEKVSIDFVFANIGLSQVSNTIVEFESSNSDKLELDNAKTANFEFMGGEEITVSADFKANAEFYEGEQLNINYNLMAGVNSQYMFNGKVQITLGTMPEYYIKNGTYEVATAKFYDSGGKENNYADYENYTLTFKPHYQHQGLFVDFNEFNIEQMPDSGCYDILYIYDGSDDQAPLIGEFCNNNFKKKVYSQNKNGALTFRFYSDNGINDSGWEALVSSDNQYTVNIIVSDGINAVEDAEVTFVNTTLFTDNSGKSSFNYTLGKGAKSYEIKLENYSLLKGTLGNIHSDTSINVTINKLPNISIIVYNNSTPLSGAQVIFKNDTLLTDDRGYAEFIGVNKGTWPFSISANGFADTTGYIEVNDNDDQFIFSLTEHSVQNIGIDSYNYFHVYPNPLVKNTELQIETGFKVDVLKIFDYDGRLLVIKNQPPKEFRLNLSVLNSGIYILQVNSDGKEYHKKLVVE